MLFDNEDSMQREVFIWRTATAVAALMFCGALLAFAMKRQEVVVLSPSGDVLMIRRGDLAPVVSQSAQLFANLILSFTPDEADLKERVNRASELFDPVGRNAFLLWVDSMDYIRNGARDRQSQVFVIDGRPVVEGSADQYRVKVTGYARVYAENTPPRDDKWVIRLTFVLDEVGQPRIRTFDMRPEGD